MLLMQICNAAPCREYPGLSRGQRSHGDAAHECTAAQVLQQSLGTKVVPTGKGREKQGALRGHGFPRTGQELLQCCLGDGAESSKAVLQVWVSPSGRPSAPFFLLRGAAWALRRWQQVPHPTLPVRSSKLPLVWLAHPQYWQCLHFPPWDGKKQDQCRAWLSSNIAPAVICSSKQILHNLRFLGDLPLCCDQSSCQEGHLVFALPS